MTNLDENASRGGGERLAVSARVDAKDLRKNAWAGQKAWGGRKASGGMLGPWHLGRRETKQVEGPTDNAQYENWQKKIL